MKETRVLHLVLTFAKVDARNRYICESLFYIKKIRKISEYLKRYKKGMAQTN
jgi:hypothetical protein